MAACSSSETALAGQPAPGPRGAGRTTPPEETEMARILPGRRATPNEIRSFPGLERTSLDF